MKNNFEVPNRIQDVVSLITLLALNPLNSYRTPEYIVDNIGIPISGKNWEVIGEQHKEFFRISPKSGNIILLARFAKDIKNDNKAPLEFSETKELISIAIELQRSQINAENNVLQRKNINRVFLAALFAGIVSLFASGVSFYRIQQANTNLEKLKTEIIEEFQTISAKAVNPSEMFVPNSNKIKALKAGKKNK